MKNKDVNLKEVSQNELKEFLEEFGEFFDDWFARYLWEARIWRSNRKF